MHTHTHTQILATPQCKGHCGGREGLPASSCFEVLLLPLLRKLEFAEAKLEPDSLDSIPVPTVWLSDFGPDAQPLCAADSPLADCLVAPPLLHSVDKRIKYSMDTGSGPGHWKPLTMATVIVFVTFLMGSKVALY